MDLPGAPGGPLAQHRPWILLDDGTDAGVHLGGECLSAQATGIPRLLAWYFKPQATFSDCLALVRCTIWADRNRVNSTHHSDTVLIPSQDWERRLDQLADTA
jgi:hypothetical protein